MRFLDYAQELADAASRFEGGTVNHPALVGFGESLRLITTAGLDKIERHVLALTRRLVEGAVGAGIPVISSLEQHARSGIVLLGRGQQTVEDLSKRADAAHVQVTIRETGVRVAPHGYNTADEIDRVLDVVSGGRL
jgi:selenocysteine lyase/cysteine desulfurase